MKLVLLLTSLHAQPVLQQRQQLQTQARSPPVMCPVCQPALLQTCPSLKHSTTMSLRRWDCLLLGLHSAPGVGSPDHVTLSPLLVLQAPLPQPKKPEKDKPRQIDLMLERLKQ